MAMLADNIFQKIIERKIPARIVHEDDLCLAFHDAHPQAPTHVLIIPKKCIRTHKDLTAADEALMGHLHLTAMRIAAAAGLDSYRLALNCDAGAGQTVPHLHLHLLAGRPFAWPPG